ncbi:MAG: 30S ribosome-binding factor RbfA [Ruminococcaceae bacterium]|nr:30S ribosome-binding factor RbfA [Oscillospiraceae bacterium]
MAGYRRGRVNEEVTRELSAIIREVKDPRVSNALVSITAADVTADMKYAKIYFSCIGNVNKNEVKKGLESASGFMRKQIAIRLNLRQTPELKFYPDDSIEYGANINRLLKQVEDDLHD